MKTDVSLSENWIISLESIWIMPKHFNTKSGYVMDCSQFMPRLLTDEQKQKYVNTCHDRQENT
jgi:hypothetical protein